MSVVDAYLPLVWQYRTEIDAEQRRAAFTEKQRLELVMALAKTNAAALGHALLSEICSFGVSYSLPEGTVFVVKGSVLGDEKDLLSYQKIHTDKGGARTSTAALLGTGEQLLLDSLEVAVNDRDAAVVRLWSYENNEGDSYHVSIPLADLALRQLYVDVDPFAMSVDSIERVGVQNIPPLAAEQSGN